VAWAGHDLLAFRLVSSTLLREGGTGLLDIASQCVDMFPTQRLLASARTMDGRVCRRHVVIILGFKRFLHRVPGAVVAVILSMILSSSLDR
jgi:hypothetical protein